MSDFNEHLCTMCPISLAKNVSNLWVQYKNSTVKCLYISIISVSSWNPWLTISKKFVPANNTAGNEFRLGRSLIVEPENKKANKMTINVAFMKSVTYTREVIEKRKRLQLACQRVF